MNAPLLIALLPAALAAAGIAAYYWSTRTPQARPAAAATRRCEPADLPPRPPRPAAKAPKPAPPPTWPPVRHTPRPPAAAKAVKAAPTRHPTWVGRARVASAPEAALVIDEAGRFWAAPTHASHDADALAPVWAPHWSAHPTPHEQRAGARHNHMRRWEHAHDALYR